MSEREQIQEQLEQYLSENEYFSAPYGVLTGLESVGKGKVRTIAFGVSRYLDATILIWSKNKISVRGQGGLSYKFEGTYSSAEQLIEHFNKETNFQPQKESVDNV